MELLILCGRNEGQTPLPDCIQIKIHIVRPTWGDAMTVDEYLGGIAQQLVHELEPILKVKEVTTNSTLLGAYTEAAVRKLSQRVVAPMRVSTGAVIDYPMPENLRQIDAILWAPFPAPGIFEINDFALVPRSSAFGLLEIKRSNYSRVDDELDAFAADAPNIAAAPHPKVPGDNRHPGMGVVCVLEKDASSRLRAQLEANKAIAIFHKPSKESSTATIRATDVLRLVNFLHFVGWRYRMHANQPEYPQLVTK
jgi:hypothetical protein